MSDNDVFTREVGPQLEVTIICYILFYYLLFGQLDHINMSTKTGKIHYIQVQTKYFNNGFTTMIFMF